MWDTIITIIGVVILLVVIELLELPAWISRKLRGNLSNREIGQRIHSLESRLDELEKKQSSKN